MRDSERFISPHDGLEIVRQQTLSASLCYNIGMQKFQSFDGVQIAYWDMGEGEPILLLHGFTANSEINWVKSGIADDLLKSGRRVVMVDARGHGESEKPHTSYSYWNRAMAKDVGELAMYLMLYNYDVLGYSMGAKVAIETELMYARIRSLTLAGLHIYDKDWTLSDKERKAKVKSMLDDNPKEKDEYRKFAEKTGGDRKAFAARLEGNIYPEFSHWDLKKIHLPVLIINGKREYDAAQAASFFPNARGVSLRANHVTLLRNKNFSNEVLTFLKELDKKN